ncbi:MAG: alpha/beta hydrolase [Nakamurella sp.]
MAEHSPDGAVLHRAAGSRHRGGPVVLLLHGGDENPNTKQVWPCWPPVLRMWAIVPWLTRGPARPAVHLLRDVAQGWNGGAGPIRDARWAIAVLRQRYPHRPIVLVGHSMGGRVGAAVVGEQDVVGFVGLAPWLPAGEPVADLSGRQLVLIQGSVDRSVPADQTRAWVDRASRQCTESRLTTSTMRYLEIPGGGHMMLRSLPLWHRLAARGVDLVVTARQL